MKGCEFQMKMKSVKAVLIFLLLLAGMVTGYLLWSMREPEYEKEGMLVENEVTAYYNMTETGSPAWRDCRGRKSGSSKEKWMCE